MPLASCNWCVRGCRRQEEEDAAAEEEELVTTIADANFGLIPDDGDDTADLASVGRRIQVLHLT